MQFRDSWSLVFGDSRYKLIRKSDFLQSSISGGLHSLSSSSIQQAWMREMNPLRLD